MRGAIAENIFGLFSAQGRGRAAVTSTARVVPSIGPCPNRDSSGSATLPVISSSPLGSCASIALRSIEPGRRSSPLPGPKPRGSVRKPSPIRFGEPRRHKIRPDLLVVVVGRGQNRERVATDGGTNDMSRDDQGSVGVCLETVPYVEQEAAAGPKHAGRFPERPYTYWGRTSPKNDIRPYPPPGKAGSRNVLTEARLKVA